MKKPLISILSMVLAATLSACQGAAPQANSNASQASSAASTQPASSAEPVSSASSEAAAPDTERPFTDSVGRTVTLPAQIERIAVTGPLAQMVIWPLAGEKLAGVSTKWSDSETKYVGADLTSLPVLGQVYGTKGEINLEELIKTAPQVVIDVGEPKDTISEDMDTLQSQTGIPFVHITAGYANAADAYTKLGELLGTPERAQEIADYLSELKETFDAANSRIGNEKKSFLYCVGEQGAAVIAEGSYHAEIMNTIGNNIAVVENPSSKGTGNEVNFEQMLLWNPEVLLFSPDFDMGQLQTNPAWAQLKAVQDGNCFQAPGEPYNWMGFPPSVQRYLGAMWMYAVMYPEQSGLDLKTEVQQYFKVFYDYDLTDEEFSSIVGELS